MVKDIHCLKMALKKQLISLIGFLYVEDTNLQKPVGQSKEFKLSSTPKTTPEDMPF